MASLTKIGLVYEINESKKKLILSSMCLDHKEPSMLKFQDQLKQIKKSNAKKNMLKKLKTQKKNIKFCTRKTNQCKHKNIINIFLKF